MLKILSVIILMTIKIQDFDLKKISYKTLIGAKPLRIRFVKVIFCA